MPEDQRIHVLDEAEVRSAIVRMAGEVVGLNGGTDDLALMGIHRRGTHIADLMNAEIERLGGAPVESGSIDITLYRDDLEVIGPRPVVGGSRLPPSGLDDKVVVIVDDVAYTGRTAHAAMNELADWGRPRRVLLCVLVDRGDRELPIQPDVTGCHVDVADGQRVEVLVPELDGRLAVELLQIEPEG